MLIKEGLGPKEVELEEGFRTNPKAVRKSDVLAEMKSAVRAADLAAQRQMLDSRSRSRTAARTSSRLGSKTKGLLGGEEGDGGSRWGKYVWEGVITMSV